MDIELKSIYDQRIKIVFMFFSHKLHQFKRNRIYINSTNLQKAEKFV